jgi:hypothetical protein
VTHSGADRRSIGSSPDGAFDVRIVTGGPADAGTEAAIAVAVARVLRERDRERTALPSAWARAGRSEASDGRLLRSREVLLGALGAAGSMLSEARGGRTGSA